MKHYLLLLKSSDFSKNGNVWTTSYINLYNNNSYSNFSYVRSYGGLNLISDRTYTGIELASPNSNGEDATPISSNAMYVTDAGEVVYDSATPSVIRFLDTSSRVDIISYKHVFVNLPGTHRPGFSIQFYESDQPTGPWLKSAYGSGSGTVLLDNVKPYVKIELTLDDQDISLDEVGLVFYLEVGIHEIVPKNTSKAAREILERFPSWTKIYEDSQEGSTPTLDVPVSVGGKLINSLTGTGLDDIQRRIDLESINSFLASADESMLAWAYVSYNIPANVINVQGDSVRLAKVGSFSDLAALRPTDYGYYINNIDGQLITNRLFDVLTIDGIPVNQQAINIYNTFDDFGAKVGLPRLYLESNANYRKRIYDATANLSGVTEQAFKLALRRELDIWRAEGATPDSEYSGATPEVLDMEHLQTSTPYFSIYGHPEQKFIDLIEKINIEYPSNIGYVNWGEGTWDYGGLLGQGISRIPAVYDDMASPIGTYYKPGVGDLEDLKLSFDYEDSATINFNGAVQIQGITNNSYRDLYTPVNIDYEVSVGYTQQVIKEASPGAALVYELEFNEFGDLATPTTFYANLSYNNRDDFSPRNIATPNQYNGIEYNFIEIFDQDGYSVDSVPFRRKDDNQLIFLADSTPSLNKAFFDDVDKISIYHTVYWDVDTQSYVDVPVSDYKFSFSTSAENWTSFPSPPVINQLGDDIDGEAAYNRSGFSVSLSSDGTVVAIGAEANNDNGTISGHVRVYEWNSNTSSWVQKGSDIDGEAAYDRSGWSVSLSSDGTIVAIGAPNNDGTSGSEVDNRGHVRVYEWSGSAWVQKGSDIDGEAAGDESGYSVSLSSDGTVVAIGAHRNDGNGSDSGHVRVYEWNSNTSSWVQKGSDIDGESPGIWSGWSVSLSSDGNVVAVGARYSSDNGSFSGHVRVYEWNSGTSSWVQIGSDIDGEAVNDNSGNSVSLSSDGTVVAVGAFLNDGNGTSAGHVRVYEWSGSAWVQKGSDIDGEAAGDESGYSVSLSSDGARVAIGAYKNDGNGSDSGHVRVYEWNSGTSSWVQIGSDIDGEAAGDQSGFSVSLSSDGTVVAVGARYNETFSGHVRVYEIVSINYSSLASPSFGVDDLNILLSSNTYSTTPEYFISESVRRSITLNTESSFESSSSTTPNINFDVSNILLPPHATPQSIYVDTVVDSVTGEKGGRTVHPISEESIFIPSSPNITITEILDTPQIVGISFDQLGSDIDGEASGDYSGVSVDLSYDGSILAVGAHNNDDGGAVAGHVRVYQWSGSSWNQLGSDIDGQNSLDVFGWSVSLSSDGNYLAAGAYGSDGNANSSSGSATVFQYTQSGWTQLGQTINGESANDQLGRSISLSSDHTMLVTGSPGNTMSGDRPGQVQVFELSGSSWIQMGSDIDGNSNGDGFGWTTAIAGDVSIIAAASSSNANAYVKVFQWSGSTWDQIGSDISGSSGISSLAISANGQRIVFGEQYNSELAQAHGKVYTYDWNGSSWVQSADPLYGEYPPTSLNFGSSIDISEDGMHLIVGQTEFFGSGRAKVYYWSDSGWVEADEDLVGEYYGGTGGTGDEFGYSVAIAGDASAYAAGGIKNDGNGTDSGHVRVYSPDVTYSSFVSESYFESSTLNYASVNSLIPRLENIGNYPLSVRQWAEFSEQTTPNLYQGYIDQYGNAYRHDEDPVNSYYNDDRLVGKYYLSSDSFNLDSESSYIIEKISLISDNSTVIQYVKDINSLVSDFNYAIENSEELGFDVYAEIDPYAERDYKSSIHAGLVDVDEEEYFVFADPKTETFTSSQDFEHDLEFIPRMGHPVILTVGNDEYRNVFFEDSATPGKYSFSNTETVSYNENNIIQLAYKDVHVNYVKDLFTGINIFEDIPTSGSIFSEFSEATPMLEGHTYEINYRINNSFFVDKDYYNEVSDSYMARLYVSSTPNSPEDYVVTYEKSKENEHLEIDLRIDGIENPLDEGFVYLSTSEHDFEDLDKYLSPMSISDDPDDLMYLTVVSKDSVGNLKPNQSFRVTSNNVSATPEYITTSDNGIGKSILRYSGSVPSSDRSDYILIEGLATSDVNADPNSDTDGYSATVNYSILTNSEFILSVKAAPARYHYDADGTTYVNITGQVYWRDEPLHAEVDIDWYVSDSLISLYSTPDYDYYGTVTSDTTGKFSISGQILVNDAANPETRFASLEISDPQAVRTIVGNLGEVLSDKLITIGGDIVYWNEEYDSIQYGAEITPLNSIFSHMKDDNSDLYATPNFVYRHNDSGAILNINNSYTWAPPQWVPLSRFDQYQMGLFGSTPDYIEDYTVIHPDSSEQ